MPLQTQLTDKQTLLEAYKAAELSILGGAQSYAIGSRSLTRANLAEVTRERKRLEEEVLAIEAAIANGGRRKVVRVILRDL